MRGSTRPQNTAVAAGRIAPKTSASTGTMRGQSSRFGYVVPDPDDIGETGAGLGEGALDIAEGLPRLLGRIVGDRHRRVVEAGRAGDEHPLAIDHGAAVAGLASNSEPDEISRRMSAPAFGQS